MIGNDVVDLLLPGVRGKFADGPFVQRVLTRPEQACLCHAPDPDLALWAMWAAKEATFKALRRMDEALVFSPRAFEVQGPAPHGPEGAVTGTCEREDHAPCALAWTWTDSYLHCVAWPVAESQGAEDLSIRVAGIAADCTPADRSLAVREVACALLEERGVPGARIERPSLAGHPGPPVAMRGNAQLEGVTVSLSHDGRWVAATLRVEPCSEAVSE